MDNNSTEVFDMCRILQRANGSYPKFTKKLLRAKAIILDDLGLAPMSTSDRSGLFEFIEDRHGASPTIVKTHLPIEHWQENNRDPTIADAILDRLVRNAHKINRKGESKRKLRSPLTNKSNVGK